MFFFNYFKQPIKCITLANLLIEREVIFAEDVEKIFGKRPWASRSEEIFDKNEENNANINNGETPQNETEAEASENNIDKNE